MDEKDIKELIEQEVTRQLKDKKNKYHIFGNKKKVHAGERVVLQNTLFNVISGEIHIGDYAFFGHNCMVLTGSHDITETNNYARQKAVPQSGNDIIIGKGVWIGSGAIVIGPATIGENSVIGAGSVVLPGKYESNSFYAGYPAKYIKNIDIDKT